MAERSSRIVLLCEDDAQEQLVRAYAKKCGVNTQEPYFLPRNASRAVAGGNVGWVLREFPKELRACRARHVAKAATLLVVIIDADDKAVEARLGELIGDPAVSDADPLVRLVPKRHIETWIRNAQGTAVDESISYKNPEPTRAEIREAASTIYSWTIAACPPPVCTPSLASCLPELRRIR